MGAVAYAATERSREKSVPHDLQEIVHGRKSIIAKKQQLAYEEKDEPSAEDTHQKKELFHRIVCVVEGRG